MKALFWVIVLFALAVGLVVAARYNEGYVLVVLPPYRVEVSLNLLFVLLAAAFVVLYTLLRLVTTAVQTPSRVREYRLARRREAAQSALVSAVEAYFEGEYAKAEQAALQSVEVAQHRQLALALAARAAGEQGAVERRDAYLRQAAEGVAAQAPAPEVTPAAQQPA